MYLGHGKFHEYSNFMKVMLEVYCEPSLQKLAKLKQVLGKVRFLDNMVLCTKFVEDVDNFVHTFRSIGILFTIALQVWKNLSTLCSNCPHFLGKSSLFT
jgi:hypothetical protein